MTAPIQRLLFKNVLLYGDRPGWLLTEGSRISRVGYGDCPAFDNGLVTYQVSAEEGVLLPGFIDLHVHGAVGHEVMDADPQALVAMAKFYARHGVTGWLATTWTASQPDILKALEAVKALMQSGTGGAAILGAHLEGPYLNAGRSGAQDTALIRPASLQETQPLLDSGIVRLVAIAPEVLANLALLDECVKRGITVSAGHTAATYEDMQAAVQRGLTQTTHTYNAMSPLNHRQPGVVGAALTMPELRCELIADNIHVHPAAMRILQQAKGTNGLILITDAIRATGLADGVYPISAHDPRPITLKEGAARLADGTLAGSVLTLERGLRNLMDATGKSISELWPATSLNAARAIGLSASKGRLEPGMDADLVLMNLDCEVIVTLVGGEIVYS
jgi:N-acetylglucosamine-6-phosphate deacetylase